MPGKRRQFSLLDIISNLERPFKLEQKYNFNNRSCDPSFRHYINHWLEKSLDLPQSEFLLKRLKNLKSIFEDYDSQNIDERRKIFKKSEKLLREAKTFVFLGRDIQYVKGVGPKRASDLKKLGIVKTQST